MPTKLPVSSQVALVWQDVARHEKTLGDHSKRLRAAETGIAVLAVRVGIYAAVGSCVGGAIAVAVARFLFPH